MKSPVTHFILAVLLLAPLSGGAADAEQLKFFEHKIRPLLSAECFECHGEEKQKGGLRLDHIDFINKGGDTSPALVAGKPGESLLMKVVRREDPDFAMPPKSELTKEQVGLLEEWIKTGAPWPEEPVQREETDEHGFTAEDHDWWAIQPLAKVTLPPADGDWTKNEVDRFISRTLKKNHLKPAKVAGGAEMVRRIYFDLHGLPPTAEESDAFVKSYQADPDKTVAETVDRLLASPRYGERWGQHWLDVVRYSESDGYRADDLRPDSWRYRDYVIQSFNADKPYDQFVREQIAGDEFAADDPDKLIGTAFLRHGVYEWNQRNAKMQWELIMTEMANVTGEVFLGVSVGCAQCHDHKFDPILQKDYFALQAFLNTTWWPENATLATPKQRAEYNAAMTKWDKETAAIQKEIDALKQPKLDSDVKFVVKQFPADVQVVYNKPQSERTAYEEQLAQLVQRQVDNKHKKLNWEKEFEKKPEILTKYKTLTAKLKEFDDRKPKPLPAAFITTDVKPKPATTFFKQRNEKVSVEPAFFTLLDLPAPVIKPTGRTTGRRSALAEWIASEKNPLSTRVIVNRVWQHHFEKGLVPTPNDFGRLGEEPSHPELLDWLTTQFLDGGWKIKPLHRLVMNSATYRQTAQREPTSDESTTDPLNRLLWRYPPRRLDAEQIRDAMLASSGELAHRDGGPSVSGTSKNRSVYVTKRRNTKDPMIGGFDAPTGFSSAPQRTSTTTPTQSLLLINGEWTNHRATAFAKRILAGGKTIEADQVRSAYRIAYGREPMTAEVEGALAFIRSQAEAVGAPAPPEPKFPGETGFRPTDQYFKGIEKPALGSRSLWLQPGSRFERLAINGVKWPEEEFTIEAIANIDSLHKDASVNTLAGRWSGSNQQPGWAFGVTSEKSRYEPRNFIMQLVGEDFQHNVVYEVVASNLRFPIQKPTYIAASISAKPQPGAPTAGVVTFYLKDLSDPKAPLQVKKVSHQIVGGLSAKDNVRALLGGRDQKGHLWDGQLARITVSKGALTEEQLLINQGKADRVFDFDFSGTNGEIPAPNTAWLREPSAPASSGYPPALLGAVSDFCHALLTSNEFLYLH